MNLIFNFVKKYFRKKCPVLLVDKTSSINSLMDKTLDIILSPSFYWVKREKLPVHSVSAAKKIAPSLFESILPPGNYSYHILKKDNIFEIIAYDDNAIILDLEKIGIKSSQINAIYFAQTEIPHIDKAIKIDEQMAMINNDGIWVIIPIKYTKEYVEIEDILKDINLKEKITINKFKNFVLKESQLYKIITLFIILILLYTLNYWILRQDFKVSLIEKNRIINQYHLPLTSFQITSIKKELQNIENKQLKLRKVIKNITMLPLLKGEKFQKIIFKGSRVTFTILIKNPKRAEKFKKIISKKNDIIFIKVVDSIMNVGVKI